MHTKMNTNLVDVCMMAMQIYSPQNCVFSLLLFVIFMKPPKPEVAKNR